MTREIPLTQGRVALVDDEDYDRVRAVGRWQFNACGDSTYATHGYNDGAVRLHSLLTGWPLVDHINGNGLDNRRANLRPATASQNAANAARPSHNTSGYKGAAIYKRTGRWRAYITVHQEHIHLGYFATAEEAARAYDRAAIETWGEYARTNFPREDYAA